MPFEFDTGFVFSGEQEKMKMHTAERVKQYASRLSEYKRPTYNETEVRVDFVNPFFKSLGWDVLYPGDIEPLAYGNACEKERKYF